MEHLCRITVAALALQLLTGCLDAKEEAVSDFSPKLVDESSMRLATLGTGCFWCTEALLETLDGVKSVTSGYSGGHKENPTYKEVCSETTGHAEECKLSSTRKQSLTRRFFSISGNLTIRQPLIVRETTSARSIALSFSITTTNKKPPPKNQKPPLLILLRIPS